MAVIQGYGPRDIQMMSNHIDAVLGEFEKSAKALSETAETSRIPLSLQQIKKTIKDLNEINRKILNKKIEVEKVGLGLSKLRDLTNLHNKIQSQICKLAKKLETIKLPDVNLQVALSFLGAKDLVRFSQVSRTAQEIADDNKRWKDLCAKDSSEESLKTAIEGEVRGGIEINRIDFKQLYKHYKDIGKTIGSITVFLKTLNGRTLPLLHNEKTTIEQIKKLFCINSGMSICDYNKIRMTFSGLECRNDATLSDLKVEDDSLHCKVFPSVADHFTSQISTLNSELVKAIGQKSFNSSRVLSLENLRKQIEEEIDKAIKEVRKYPTPKATENLEILGEIQREAMVLEQKFLTLFQ